MHYQHRYHAGNFADVFKHVILCSLLQALSRKDKPWLYLETHAGAGRYDLGDEAAAKTGEWQDGIGKLRGMRMEEGPLSTYLAIVQQMQQADPNAYPGSPLLVLALARATDRLVLCEKVPAVCEALRMVCGGEPRIHVHQRDGYETQGLLPPAEKRGLVLIDPPFERPDEFDAVADYLLKATKRFETGVYAVWYPLKNRYEADRWRRRLQRELPRGGIDFRFDTAAPGEGQMRACGVCVINPPFGLERDLGPSLQRLSKELAQGPRAGLDIESWEAPAAR